MMLVLMTMLIMLMALMALDDSVSLFLFPLPHLREMARIRRLVCFSQTCLLFVFREEDGVEFLLHYLPKWRGGGGDDDSSKMIRMNEDKDDIQAKEIGMKMKMAKMFELQ